MTRFASKRMLEKMVTEVVPFRDSVTDIKFEAKPVDIFLVEGEFNRIIVETSEATVYDWMDCLGIADFNYEHMHDWGWSSECLWQAGENWVEIEYEYVKGENGEFGYFLIIPSKMPCDGYRSCFYQDD